MSTEAEAVKEAKVAAEAEISSNPYEAPPISELKQCLNDCKAPIAKRTRAVFWLRHLRSNEAVDALATGLGVSSVLLAHEVAYCLGQMQNPHAIPSLTEALKDRTKDPIVRHEAAEALAAIGQEDVLPLLEEYCQDESSEVAETCKISVERLKWNIANKDKVNVFANGSAYHSVDPAPPLPVTTPVAELQAILLDTKLSHFERYRAMFALRNRNDEAAVKALASGFCDVSPVFKHEIAYVMGQMQNPLSIPYLTEVLKDEAQHAMVRHEAAEAIGAIAETESEPLLQKFQSDADKIVSESCDVALDITDYWTKEHKETTSTPTTEQETTTTTTTA